MKRSSMLGSSNALNENGYNERFNGTLRYEVLNAESFSTIGQAQDVIVRWLRQYNTIRPHPALNMRAPF